VVLLIGNPCDYCDRQCSINDEIVDIHNTDSIIEMMSIVVVMIDIVTIMVEDLMMILIIMIDVIRIQMINMKV
jgi:hypothetical protein